VDEGQMTANRNVKRRVRARAAKTGESYAAALRHVRPGQGDNMPEGNRPHNSMYVISDRGELVTRYDERLLSSTKLSFMYTPGSGPVTFEADGLRFGCAMGIEVHFPELFAEYERLDVDGVLFSSTGPGRASDGAAAFAAEAQAYAAAHSLWLSFAMSAQHSAAAPAGIIAPDGRWAARCPGDGRPAVAIADLDNRPESIDIAVARARPWRRLARAGIYDAHLVSDDRSDDRRAF
jgi:predicted amidohydrolase